MQSLVSGFDSRCRLHWISIESVSGKAARISLRLFLARDAVFVSVAL